MIDGGVGDVLVSNELAGARKLERLATLSTRAKVCVCTDDADNVATSYPGFAAALTTLGATIRSES